MQEKFYGRTTGNNMPPLPPNLDPSRAVTLARASCAAYRATREGIAEMLLKSNLSGRIELFESGDTEGFIFTDEDQCIVSFRGSASIGDWVNNASVDLVAWRGRGRVHAGFNAALNLVWMDIMPIIRERAQGRTLWLTGHSLGGALAVLAAMRLSHDVALVADGIYTFGMPKVGDDAFAAAFSEHQGDRAFTFLNEGDLVPWLPIIPDGFAVACHGLRFDQQGKLHPRPSFFGAALLMLMGMIGKPQDQWLNLRAHSKEEYLRLMEQSFS